MAYLIYNDQLREEFDEQIISTLLRKGWTEVTLPQFDPENEFVQFEPKSQKFLVLPIVKSFQDKINSGFLVEPEGYVLALGDNDRNLFNQMLSLIKEALELGYISNETQQTIKDKSGETHSLTTLRFRQIMVQYGFYYKSLWDQV